MQTLTLYLDDFVYRMLEKAARWRGLKIHEYAKMLIVSSLMEDTVQYRNLENQLDALREQVQQVKKEVCRIKKLLD